jgi:hypothetical protein
MLHPQKRQVYLLWAACGNATDSPYDASIRLYCTMARKYLTSKEWQEIDLTRLQDSLGRLIFFLSFLLFKYFSVFVFID